MQHGVLNFLKPPGMTSHDAVAFVRRVLKEKRVGHTGTLDPAAAGVLPICVGQATRLVEDLQAGTKRYIAEALFGRETDSGDLLGKNVRECDASALQLEQLRLVLDAFRGEIEQTPPLHSAIKVDGQKLYDLARQGKEVEIPTRQVTISHLSISRWQGGESPRAMLDIECSGGTYIRSLVRDIARAADSAATMSFLLRERSGLFSLTEAVSPAEFEREPKLIPLHEMATSLAVWKVQSDDMAFALWQGKRIKLGGQGDIQSGTGPVLVENEAGTLFALVSQVEGDLWKADKVFDLRS
ncbi:tRNA pseudouridine(55) synthase TruB [bacterium]|nr:MAG: tRNA pseudouridine(55) synthase TruB [bacterium]